MQFKESTNNALGTSYLGGSRTRQDQRVVARRQARLCPLKQEDVSLVRNTLPQEIYKRWTLGGIAASDHRFHRGKDLLSELDVNFIGRDGQNALVYWTAQQ
jgi:hypothetical protein